MQSGGFGICCARTDFRVSSSSAKPRLADTSPISSALKRRLIIEVDGGQHADSAKDEKRTAWLEAQGFRVLRFWNNDVLGNTAEVLAMIVAALVPTIKAPSPAAALRAAPPSPARGEGTEG